MDLDRGGMMLAAQRALVFVHHVWLARCDAKHRHEHAAVPDE
jgi:hypothetical protein